ncbi:MAG TPA: hypothetical protein VFB51_05320 [Solirubrobacterales bacterium]|nr:hypothetical protein [Solirubrobacterales bacterium]
MQRSVETFYGLGRLAFGVGLLAAPAALGRVLVGGDAGRPAVRGMLRFYGTRDTVLGLGTLRAAAAGTDTDGWITAGVLSDLLDAGVMLAEWGDIQADKRMPGLGAALGAAAAGVALLARR